MKFFAYKKLVRSSNTDLLILLFLLSVSGFFLFLGLGRGVLMDWDEGLYANIVGEIVRGGDWLSLKLQSVPWFDKEPLGFWLMALSVKLFGFSVFALRLPSVLISIFLAPLFYIFLRKRYSQLVSGFVSVILFFSPFLWLPHMFRTGDLDALAVVLFLVSFVFYIYKRDSKYWWLSAVFIALSVLARGAWGFLHLFVLLIAEVSRPGFGLDRWSFKKLFLFVFISIFPWFFWHVLRYFEDPGAYVDIYWKTQFFNRIGGAVDGHSEPFTYYFKYIKDLVGLGWIVTVLFSVIFALIRMIKKRDWYLFLVLIWLLVVLGVPHIMETKLYWYLFPALLPIYIIFAELFKGLNEKINGRVGKITVVLVCLLYSLFLVKPVAAQIFQNRNAQPTNMEQFVENAASFVPRGSEIVVYDLHVWNFGRILPGFAWYLHFENDWKTIHIDQFVAPNYIEKYQELPWWMVSRDKLEEVKLLKTDLDFEVLYQRGDYILLKIAKCGGETENCQKL